MSGVDGVVDGDVFLLASQPVEGTVTNLLVVVAFVLWSIWSLRLLNQFYLLHRLNVAIKTGQVVRLQTADLSPHERSMFFGEMEMLWRTNLQQQLLRARRISAALDVSELRVPFLIDKENLKMVYHEEISRTVGLDFKFQASGRIALQVYWHVSAPALKELLARFNHEAPSNSGGGVPAGRRTKNFFGQLYAAVPLGGDGGSRRSRSLEMSSVPSGTDEVGRTQSPLFQDAQCCSRSGVVALRETPEDREGARAWGHFESPEPSRVLSAPLRHCDHATPPGGTPAAAAAPANAPSSSAPPGELTLENIDSPQASARAAEAGESAEEGRASGHDGPGGGVTRNTLTVVIVAKPLGFPEPAPSGSPVAEANKDAETVSLVLFVAQEVRSGRNGNETKLEVIKQVVVTNRAAYVNQEIYGEEDEEGNSEECVICFCEPKDTTLLPCRHLCVCRECFARLENCPVCRSSFTAYLRQPRPGGAEAEEDEEAAGAGVGVGASGAVERGGVRTMIVGGDAAQ
ncbi:hypothetical protein T484DRAFT_1934167 [Baffinella frigidus]|nr:hypothetical protein T484DRAFT_1934167 [Cryptophyta sp. CCMP2293]